MNTNIVEDDINSLKMALTSLRINTNKLKLTPSLVVVAGEEVVENLLPEISLKEVALHDSFKSCWIIIYDRVYDVTNFLNAVSKTF